MRFVELENCGSNRLAVRPEAVTSVSDTFGGEGCLITVQGCTSPILVTATFDEVMAKLRQKEAAGENP